MESHDVFLVRFQVASGMSLRSFIKFRLGDPHVGPHPVGSYIVSVWPR